MRPWNQIAVLVSLLALAVLAPTVGNAQAAQPSYGLALRSTAANVERDREGDIACYFSPHGGCTEAVVRELDAAKETVLVQAYSFTSTPIAKALIEAHRRGVKITVILDKSNRKDNYSAADFVAHADIPCYIDAQHSIAHNKVILIDGRTIITGSFNFTKAAETSNAENLLVIHNHPQLFAAYETNFKKHLAHSEAYAGR
jgi:phosphatidylserine/phosphatidylglycerophosphate/cardiolipin synthase-like enzyme